MVKIPRAEQRVGVQIADMPMSSGDGYSAVGRAVQGLGSSIGQLGGMFDAMAQQSSKEDQHLDRLTMLEGQNALDQRMIVMRQEAENNNGMVTYQGQQMPLTQAGASVAQEHFQTYGTRIRTPQGRQAFALHAESARGTLNNQNLSLEYDLKKRFNFEKTEATLSTESEKLKAAFSTMYPLGPDGQRLTNEKGEAMPMPAEKREEMQQRISSGVRVMAQIINSYEGPIGNKAKLWNKASDLLKLQILDPSSVAPADQKAAYTAAVNAVSAEVKRAEELSRPEHIRGNLGPMTGTDKRLPTDSPAYKGPMNVYRGPSNPESLPVYPPLTSGKSRGEAHGWARSNGTWRSLDPFQKAAAMALMEADGSRIDDARNALGAMINRASKGGEDLGAHVSRKIYQPTMEPAQERRLNSILRSPQFGELTKWAVQRAAGKVPDPVNGATHFLATEQTMLALERGNPRKYRSWRSWTNFDSSTSSYRGVITRDRSHAFLAPDGSYSLSIESGGDAPPSEGNPQSANLPRVRVSLKGLNDEQKAQKLEELASKGYRDFAYVLSDTNEGITAKPGNKFNWGPTGAGPEGGGANVNDPKQFSGPKWASGTIAKLQAGEYDRPANTIPGAQGSDVISGDAVSDGAEVATRGVRVADASGQTIPQSQPGVAATLLGDLQKLGPAVEKRHQSIVSGMIKDVEDAYEKGYRHSQLDSVKRFVMESGNPALVNYFNSVVGDLETYETLQPLPIEAMDRFVQLQRKALSVNATPAQISRVERFERLLKNASTELAKDPLGWAEKVQPKDADGNPIVPILPRIDTSNVTIEQLQERYQAAKAVSAYYKRDLVLFRPGEDGKPGEREQLQAVLMSDPKRALVMMGSMHRAFGQDMPVAIKEIAKDFPEMAQAAALMSQGVNIKAAEDIVKYAHLKKDPNFKARGINGTIQSEVLGRMIGDVYDGNDNKKTSLDQIRKAADAVAIMSSGANDEVTTEMYEKAVSQVLGEREQKAQKFGGIAIDKEGKWFGGHGVPLPVNWSQKNWKNALREGVTPDILAATGHDQPTYGDGSKIPLHLLFGTNARFIQVAEGKYKIQIDGKFVGSVPAGSAPPEKLAASASEAQRKKDELATKGQSSSPFSGDFFKGAPDHGSPDRSWTREPGYDPDLSDGVETNLRGGIKTFIIDFNALEPRLKIGRSNYFYKDR